MVWFKVDDGFAFHPKALAAGNAALGLWVRAGSWCGHNLTNGFMPASMLGALGGRVRDAQKLIDAGLWTKVEPNSGHRTAKLWPQNSQTLATVKPNSGQGVVGSDATAWQGMAGYQFADWAQWQPTKEQVRAEREATRVRVAKWREEQRNAVTPTVTNGVSTDAPTRPDPTRPEPVLPTEVPGLCSPTEKTQRGKRLPADWQPTPELVAFVTAECPNVDGRSETASFCDYWHAKAGRDALRVDWSLTYQKWMRDEQKRSRGRPRSNSSSRPSTTDQRINDGRDVIRRLAQQEHIEEQRQIGASS